MKRVTYALWNYIRHQPSRFQAWSQCLQFTTNQLNHKMSTQRGQSPFEAFRGKSSKTNFVIMKHDHLRTTEQYTGTHHDELIEKTFLEKQKRIDEMVRKNKAGEMDVNYKCGDLVYCLVEDKYLRGIFLQKCTLFSHTLFIS